MTSLELLKKHLKDNKYSATSSRLTVFQSMEKLGPCSIQELEQDLSHKTHRSSVYRAIQLFEELGVVRRIPIGWKYKLELSDMFTDHHHHAHCIRCEAIITLEEHRPIERAITQLARDNDLEVTSHSLEIHGVCGSCQKHKN